MGLTSLLHCEVVKRKSGEKKYAVICDISLKNRRHYYFFTLFQNSRGKHEASAERESRATRGARKNITNQFFRAPPVARDSRSALSSCLTPLA